MNSVLKRTSLTPSMVFTLQAKIPPPTATSAVAITKALPANIALLRFIWDIADMRLPTPGDVSSEGPSALNMELRFVVVADAAEARALSFALRSETVVPPGACVRRGGGAGGILEEEDEEGVERLVRFSRGVRARRWRRTMRSGMAMATLVPINCT